MTVAQDPIAPTPENMRAELARVNASYTDLAREGGLHPNLVSQYLRGYKKLTRKALTRLVPAINKLCFDGRGIFYVPRDL